ncbi:hypothetical protein AA103196_1771 [Ameyamaea chiangmaiensis NBRC 103196]|nr:hypothetical protein AA103196_1771 [Ameyamaea chiangmaiensis NBRC 103196]
MWVRAPLWRLCLYLTVFFAALALIYPAPYLLRAVPVLDPIVSRVNHWLGRDTAPTAAPAPSDNGAASGGGGSAAVPPPAADSSAASDPANTEQVATPPITADLHAAIPFAGRILPLPAGTWHPVLSTQAGPHRELLTNVLVRTDRGVVTGVVVAHGSTSSMPPSTVSDLENGCHDDRNYMSRVVPAGPRGMECWTTNYAMLDQKPMTMNPDVNAAFERLHVLGFQVPPLMLMGTWNRADAAADGGVNLENVTILLSPARPGTITLPNPPEAYLKEALKSVPASADLVNRLNTWMTGWVKILKDGYDGKIKADAIPAAAARDPSAP